MTNRSFEVYQDRSATNTRLTSLCLIVGAIFLGLWARTYRNEALSNVVLKFIVTYAGDTLWAVTCFFVGRLLLIRSPGFVLGIGTLMVTIGIEISQLWKPEWLETIREKPIFGFLLGRTFLWSDVACLVVGVGVAVCVDRFFVAKSSQNCCQR